MKNGLLISTLLLSSIGNAGAATLKESFDGALKVNQGDEINQSKINQYKEQVTQGKSGYLPKLYLKGTYTKQENLNDIKYGNLNLTYTIFKGGKDVYTTDLAENSVKMAEFTLTADQLALYQNVINVYYNYFLNFNDAKNLEMLTKQSADRVAEIDKRVKIGRSRVGELLQARAQLAQAKAQYENAMGLAKEAEEKYKVLTGIVNSKPEVDLEAPLKTYTFNEVLEKAYQRPDIKSKELKIDEAQKNVSIAKTSHLPTLDLTSNYYFTKRYGTSYATSKTDWDAGVVLTIPLFEGFNTDAKVSENIQKEYEARYAYLDTKKQLELDLSSKFETHRRYMDQVKTFDDAVNLAKRSYDESLKDYRLGLITNLDVLTSLNLYLDTKRNTEKNKIQAIQSEKILEASLGAMP